MRALRQRDGTHAHGAGRAAAIVAALLSLVCLAGSLVASHEASVPKAHTAVDQFVPDDTAGGAGWAAVQWNFAGPFGVGAPAAWAHLIAAGAPGGAGVTVAVLDTGVGSSNQSPSPAPSDLTAAQLVPGWDFVDNDADPYDEHGHGTQVASTIVEDTNNAFGLTGLAYGARIMPIRVFNSHGIGDVDTVARGIRFAADHGAKVLNLSFAFGTGVTEADISPVLGSLEYAARRGALIVGAAGNEGAGSIDLPARSRHVLAVGATTEFGCVSAYSNYGPELDLVAPGGGADAPIQDKNCKAGRQGRGIHQLDQFGTGSGSVGTSMAVPHVSATAALVVASHVAGQDPTAAQIATRLKHTARDLGAPGYDERYGWGLVSAGAATASTGRGAAVRSTYPHGGRPE